jgi:hypothetical protein
LDLVLSDDRIDHAPFICVVYCTESFEETYVGGRMGALLRWGIAGAGGVAALVGVEAAASDASTVLAVGARDLCRTQALASRLGAKRAYGSFAQLVAAPDVDVVYVATTHAQHFAAAAMRLEAGKSVLVEKPITDSAAIPLAASLGVLEILDEARRQIGVRYPNEEE